MTGFRLWMLGLIGLSLEPAVQYFLCIDWLWVHVTLLLVVYVAFRLPWPEGAATVLALGLTGDILGGAPLGMQTCLYGVVWALVTFVLRNLLPDARAVHLASMFVLALFYYCGLAFLYLLAEGTSGSSLWVLKTMGPLALFHTLLAGPVWNLARRLSPTRRA